MLFDLPEIILSQHILQHFATAPHHILSFGSTCKAAHRIACASSLWSSFCQAYLTDGLWAYFTNPAIWRAANFQQLYIG